MKTVRETSDYVVHRILKMADIKITDNVLEPSAGEGKIVDAIRDIWPNKQDIMCVELNKEKCDVLIDKGYSTLHGDFLEVKENMRRLNQRFNKIVAAPPFKDNVDLKHIMGMYDLLFVNSDACLISLTTPYWMTNNESHQVEFRGWLVGKKHEIVMLPDMSFVEKGKTVPTAIIKIWR